MSTFTRFTAYDKVQYDHKASEILGKDYWRVLESFRFYLDDNEIQTTFVDIPLGYLTDGASIPKPLHSIIGPWGKHGQAAIVHDYLCEYLTVKQTSILEGTPISTSINEELVTTKKITRKECDRIFLECMKVLGVGTLKRNSMWYAVSLFRILGRIRNPSLDLLKFKLEVTWRQTELNKDK
jgi:hypothetical protein